VTTRKNLIAAPRNLINTGFTRTNIFKSKLVADRSAVIFYFDSAKAAFSCILTVFLLLTGHTNVVWSTFAACAEILGAR